MDEKAVMISAHPVWCGRIADLVKHLEIRKTMPKIPGPFRCYIYCTRLSLFSFWKSKEGAYVADKSRSVWDCCGNGKVIGEFVCDRVYRYSTVPEADDDISTEEITKESCLSFAELYDYECGAKKDPDSRKGLFAWHISQLKIYDKPRLLEEFGLERAPQSWCYVKEVAA